MHGRKYIGYLWSLTFEYFPQNCRENSSSVKLWPQQPVLHMKTYVHLWQYLVQFFSQWWMFQTKIVQKIGTHILCWITFFQKSCHLWDNVEKYVQPGRPQMTIQYGACALHVVHLRLHTQRLCIYYCFSTATMFRRKRRNFTLYVHCSSHYNSRLSPKVTRVVAQYVIRSVN